MIIPWGARLAVGNWTLWDLLVAGVTVSLWPIQEWMLLVYILHFRPRRILGRHVTADSNRDFISGYEMNRPNYLGRFCDFSSSEGASALPAGSHNRPFFLTGHRPEPGGSPEAHLRGVLFRFAVTVDSALRDSIRKCGLTRA